MKIYKLFTVGMGANPVIQGAPKVLRQFQQIWPKVKNYLLQTQILPIYNLCHQYHKYYRTIEQQKYHYQEYYTRNSKSHTLK
jgi:hypothetical protein